MLKRPDTLYNKTMQRYWSDSGSMATEQQLKTLDKYIDTIHEILLDQIACAKNNPERQLTKNRIIFVRMLGQVLYEAPKLHTGMVSVRLIEQKLKDFGTKAVLEHHHSRQKGGAALIALVDRALKTGILPSRADVKDIALKYCQVHYTTMEENQALRKHQRRCSSEAAYRRSNIQLIQAPDLFSKRGKHTANWKREMIEKYNPIVDAHFNPGHVQQEFDWPDIIH